MWGSQWQEAHGSWSRRDNVMHKRASMDTSLMSMCFSLRSASLRSAHLGLSSQAVPVRAIVLAV